MLLCIIYFSIAYSNICSAFIYLIALFYAITDIDAVLASPSHFPTAEIYRQATGSSAGAIGLTAVLFLATFPTLIGTLITGGRTLWTLSRDDAFPCSSFFAVISPRFDSPLRATVAVSAITSCLGCIFVLSTSAFSALIGSYIVLSTLSYAGAILPHVLTRRATIVPGPFHMGRWGLPVNVLSLVYIFAMVVLFCFPFVMPVGVKNMNYTSAIVGGLLALITVWWFVHGRGSYQGPVSGECSSCGAERILIGVFLVCRSIFARQSSGRTAARRKAEWREFVSFTPSARGD